MSFIEELKRRNVIRVAVAYIVAAWLIIQVVETLFPIYGFSDAAIRLVVTLLAIGLLPVVVLAWAFELTPEGLKKDKDVVRSQSITLQTGKKLDRIIMVVLALALVYFGFDKFVLSPQRQTEELATATQEARQQGRSEVLIESYGGKSIAVLPFVNMSGDASNEYFSEGISEELLNQLAKIPELRVISRSSAFSFKGQNLEILEIAKRLNVAHILEGSVRKAGNQVRITAQLIDARTDTHLWSETYDRELENIFDVQDEISEAIVGALKESLNIQLETAPKTITATNIQAHDAYLRGRYLVVQRTPTTIVEAAVHEFEKAITLDPDFALAHAELAIAISLLAAYGDLTVSEAIARAAPHAERAMALDPTLAEAHAATGRLLWYQEDLDEALTHFEQAIQLNPNYSFVYLLMGNLLSIELGRYAEAFPMLETALRLDPLSIPAIATYVYLLITKNRLAEADRELEKLAAISPGFYASMRGVLTSRGGKWANSVLAGLDALRIDQGHIFTRNDLTLSFAFLGLEKEALAISEVPRPVVLRILGRPGDAVTTAEARLAEDPVYLYARHDLGLALASAGDYARARPILEEIWQRSGRRVTAAGVFRKHSAAALFAIRRTAGKDAEVDELVAAIRDNVRRYQEAGMTVVYMTDNVDYAEGLAAYLAGEREKGLAMISKAVEDGFFIPQRDAYLQALYDDPGFAPIRAKQEARQASERERFLAIVCTDNPYEEDWQPAEGTCERFAAEGGN